VGEGWCANSAGHLLSEDAQWMITEKDADHHSEMCETLCAQKSDCVGYMVRYNPEVSGQPAGLSRFSAAAAATCLNTRDNGPGAKCAAQLSRGSGTCAQYLRWKDCDQSCNLCACSTAVLMTREHCSGHGTCSAECGAQSCTGAACVCDEGWAGPKCDTPGPLDATQCGLILKSDHPSPADKITDVADVPGADRHGKDTEGREYQCWQKVEYAVVGATERSIGLLERVDYRIPPEASTSSRLALSRTWASPLPRMEVSMTAVG